MRLCPECGTELEFEPGTPQSWDEPGTDDVVYCLECGYECEPSDDERVDDEDLGFDEDDGADSDEYED